MQGDEHKFAAFQARHGIAFAGASDDAVAHAAQQHVAGGHAVHVVHFGQAVKVDEGQRHHEVAPLAHGDGLAQAVHQQVPVRLSGERIEQGGAAGGNQGQGVQGVRIGRVGLDHAQVAVLVAGGAGQRDQDGDLAAVVDHAGRGRGIVHGQGQGQRGRQIGGAAIPAAQRPRLGSHLAGMALAQQDVGIRSLVVVERQAKHGVEQHGSRGDAVQALEDIDRAAKFHPVGVMRAAGCVFCHPGSL